jgi:transcriptional regulator with XRE-family HTH domain
MTWPRIVRAPILEKSMDRIDVLVGQRIRALRCARELSQADLGNLVGVTFQQIQKYENGANRVSASRLLAMAQALGVPVSHFFEGLEMDSPDRPPAEEGAEGRTPALASLLADKQFLSLAQDFTKLSARQKEAVMALVQSMSGTRDAPRDLLQGP